MKILYRHIFFFCLLLIPAAAAAQGSGSTDKGKNDGGSRKPSNLVVTRSVSGVVDSANDRSVAVKNSRGKITSLVITKNTRVGSGCLDPGRKVTARYMPNDRKATVIRCK